MSAEILSSHAARVALPRPRNRSAGILRHLTACLCAAAALLCVAWVRPAAATGVNYDGRWGILGGYRIANYPGTRVILHFTGSSSVSADLQVPKTSPSEPYVPGHVYISVSVDEGAAQRMDVPGGTNKRFPLATGLASGVAHTVVVTFEGEPFSGWLQFINPVLGAGGTWLPIEDNRPIIEVIGDSDATGTCVLGPTSPSASLGLNTPEWGSATLAWPRLLEADIKNLFNRDVDVQTIAFSGSITQGEAYAYEMNTMFTPLVDHFTAYSYGRRVQLALLWGGVNDAGGGGTPWDASRNLSPFQLGIYTQMVEIYAHNPNATIALLSYVDPTVPSWTLAYQQLRSMFPVAQQRRIYIFPIVDGPISNACDIDPEGHPNASMHASWAAQILRQLVDHHLIP
jgi:hypothetical protein